MAVSKQTPLTFTAWVDSVFGQLPSPSDGDVRDALRTHNRAEPDSKEFADKLMSLGIPVIPAFRSEFNVIRQAVAAGASSGEDELRGMPFDRSTVKEVIATLVNAMSAAGAPDKYISGADDLWTVRAFVAATRHLDIYFIVLAKFLHATHDYGADEKRDIIRWVAECTVYSMLMFPDGVVVNVPKEHFVEALAKGVDMIAGIKGKKKASKQPTPTFTPWITGVSNGLLSPAPDDITAAEHNLRRVEPSNMELVDKLVQLGIPAAPNMLAEFDIIRQAVASGSLRGETPFRVSPFVASTVDGVVATLVNAMSAASAPDKYIAGADDLWTIRVFVFAAKYWQTFFAVFAKFLHYTSTYTAAQKHDIIRWVAECLVYGILMFPDVVAVNVPKERVVEALANSADMIAGAKAEKAEKKSVTLASVLEGIGNAIGLQPDVTQLPVKMYIDSAVPVKSVKFEEMVVRTNVAPLAIEVGQERYIIQGADDTKPGKFSRTGANVEPFRDYGTLNMDNAGVKEAIDDIYTMFTGDITKQETDRLVDVQDWAIKRVSLLVNGIYNWELVFPIFALALHGAVKYSDQEKYKIIRWVAECLIYGALKYPDAVPVNEYKLKVVKALVDAKDVIVKGLAPPDAAVAAAIKQKISGVLDVKAVEPDKLAAPWVSVMSRVLNADVKISVQQRDDKGETYTEFHQETNTFVITIRAKTVVEQLALLMHESGHISASFKAVMELDRDGFPHALTNIAEDFRINRYMSQHYAGFRQGINEYMVKHPLEGAANTPLNNRLRRFILLASGLIPEQEFTPIEKEIAEKADVLGIAEPGELRASYMPYLSLVRQYIFAQDDVLSGMWEALRPMVANMRNWLRERIDYGDTGLPIMDAFAACNNILQGGDIVKNMVKLRRNIMDIAQEQSVQVDLPEVVNYGKQ